jgi:hypothetical protein
VLATVELALEELPVALLADIAPAAPVPAPPVPAALELLEPPVVGD